MAIRRATPRECFDEFVEHLNKLIHATLPTNVPLDVETRDDRPAWGTLVFRGAYTVPLPTKHHGIIHLHLGQLLECTQDKDRPASERWYMPH
ncbi:MAG TPA: hypothetical protein VKB80_00405 [Kofleriaceae bacterium]|nr:hypothetical protein [Kofleriaceae bacterium]